MDKVEHDIMNYQDQGQSYLPKSKAEAADNVDTRWIDSSQYHVKTELNNYSVLLYIFQTICQCKTLHRLEAWKQGKLWTRHDKCILYWTDKLLTTSLEMKTKKKHVVPFNLLNKILCPEKNSISLTEVFHQAELKWNGLPESTLTYHSNSLWKASSGNCSYWNLWQAGGNCSDWSMWKAGGNCSNWNM